MPAVLNARACGRATARHGGSTLALWLVVATGCSWDARQGYWRPESDLGAVETDPVAGFHDARPRSLGLTRRPDEPVPLRRPYQDLRRHTFRSIGEDTGIDVAPDGQSIVFSSTQNSRLPKIHIAEKDNVLMRALTSGEYRDIHPRFSPDGERLAFASDREGNFDIWILSLATPGVTEQLTASPDDDVHPTFSPDGKRVAFCRRSQRHGWTLWIRDRDRPDVVELGPGLYPEWSPTGEWIAFQKPMERGHRWYSVWLVRPDGSDVRQVVAFDDAGSIQPSWSPTAELLSFTMVRPKKDGGRATPGETAVQDIAILDLRNGRMFQLTHHEGRNWSPAWGLDGRIYFTSDRYEGRNILSLLPPEVERPMTMLTMRTRNPTWLAVGGALLVALAAMTGCRTFGLYLDRTENPIAGLRRVAVAPVFAPSSLHNVDGMELGDMLAAELVQFGGVEGVVRPAMVVATLEHNDLTLVSEADVRQLARLLRADGVLVAEVVDFDPYYPPRAEMVAQLFVGDALLDKRSDVIDLSRHGQARPLRQLDHGNVVQVERVYDAAQREIRDQARSYGLGHEFDAKAIEGSDRILWLSDRYFRFVSDRLVTAIFDECARQAEEVHSAKG